METQNSESPPELISPLYNRPQYHSLPPPVVSSVTSSIDLDPSNYSYPEQNPRKYTQLYEAKINKNISQYIYQPSDTPNHLSWSRPNATANSPVSSATTSFIDLQQSSYSNIEQISQNCTQLYQPEITTNISQSMNQPSETHSYPSWSEPNAAADSSASFSIPSSIDLDPCTYLIPEQNPRKCTQQYHSEINTFANQCVQQPCETHLPWSPSYAATESLNLSQVCARSTFSVDSSSIHQPLQEILNQQWKGLTQDGVASAGSPVHLS
ncbi:hypothetical protein NPIL_157321, partial [Nephila pilipes]